MVTGGGLMYGRNFWRIFRTSGPARSHAPPKYGRQNSHISQKVLEGQNEYQTVRLVPLINLILYLYIYGLTMEIVDARAISV